MKYLNLSSEITQIEVELEFLDSSTIQDILLYIALLEGSLLHITTIMK